MTQGQHEKQQMLKLFQVWVVLAAVVPGKPALIQISLAAAFVVALVVEVD